MTNHFVLCSHHPRRSPGNTYRSITPASGLLWCLRRDQAAAVKPLAVKSAPPAPGLVCTKSRVRSTIQQSSQPGTVCKLMSYPCLWLGKGRNTCKPHSRRKQTNKQTNHSKQFIFLLSPSCMRTDPTGTSMTHLVYALYPWKPPQQAGLEQAALGDTQAPSRNPGEELEPLGERSARPGRSHILQQTT